MPSLHRHADKSDGPEMASQDVTETICKVCEKSVYNASSALRRSMASVSQLSKLREMEYPQEQAPEPAMEGGDGGREERSRRTIEPIVSELEISRQQGLIDDLEWMEMRKKWEDPAIKFRLRSRT